MAVKISLIGAGSVVFAKNLIGDILQFPELSHAHICLMDIDPDRLRVAGIMARKMIARLGVAATVSETLDQRQAITHADFVICTVQVGGYKPGTVIDFEIPARYGLQQTIADTLGVGGIFRALRTIPVLVGIARDIAEVGAPGCLLLNYTNPMAMNCWAIDRAVGVPHVGLCHSVQGTSAQLAGFANVPMEDVTYLVAGINHMAFFLEFEYRGQDAYPLLFQALEDPSRRTELVRFEMMRRLGYFVTESSEHQAEYVPYFIHHGQEMIDRFEIPIDEYIRRCESCIATWERSERELLGEGNHIEIAPQTHEYGSYIIHSIVTNQPRVIYGNVPNLSYITNLPHRCCVEVPCLVDAHGVQPTRIGALPPQLAAICQTNINVQSLTVEAALTGNRDAIYHAVMLDPHASATLPLDKIWSMCDELIEAHQKVGLLGEFHPVIPGTGRLAAGTSDLIIARLRAVSPLADSMDMELILENPTDQAATFDLHINSVYTPLVDQTISVAVEASPRSTTRLPVRLQLNADPGEREKFLLHTDAAHVLAIGESIMRRMQLDTSAGPAPLSFTLAGFPAGRGSLATSDAGLTIELQITDSKVPAEQPPNLWDPSSVEVFIARTQGDSITQLFIVPQPGKSSPIVLDADKKPVPVLSAQQHITPMDYTVTVCVPWSALHISRGPFLFDCYANLSALGDAHSGGTARLNHQKNSHLCTAHFSWVHTGGESA